MRSVWRQLGRPLQIESLGSGVLLALHHAFGMPLGWASGSGSQNLTGTVAEVASAVTTIAGIAALALVWVRYARGDAESDARFVRYAAAAVVAFVAFGKVVSPQFLVWLLAIVVLVQGRRGVAAIALLVVACALTRVWFPRDYWELVKQFDPDRLVARARPRPRARRPLRRARRRRRGTCGRQGQGTRTGLIAVARPLAASHSTSTPSIRTPPVGDLEAHRHPGAHPMGGELGLDADHRVVRARSCRRR